MSLKQLLKRAINLDFKSNSFSNKIHEESVRNIIEESGFVEKKSMKELFINNYVYQPYGSQKPPDFAINYNEVIYNIECKSSKRTKKPMWNCSIPDDKTIYIFSVPDCNILFFGNWILDDKTKKIMDEFIEESKKVSKKYSDKLLKLNSDYKWKVIFRKMFNQMTIFDKNKQKVLKERMDEFINKLD